MSVRLPPLPALRAFEAAARYLSFKHAAAELHVTPGAVSQQIKALEDFLGTPLFVRLTRALELTDAARAMLPLLRDGLTALAASVEAARRPEPGGELLICAPPQFAARWLLPRLPAFRAAHPDIVVRLNSDPRTIDQRESGTTRTAEASRAAVFEGDLVVRFGRGDYPGWITERLFAPAYVPVCSPALSGPDHPIRVPADLLERPLIHDDTIPELENRPTWAQWLEMAGLAQTPDTPGLRFSDTSLVLAAAADGQGIALAARPMVSADIATGRLMMPFALSIPSTYAYFLTRSELAIGRPAVTAFCSWLATQARTEEPAASGD